MGQGLPGAQGAEVLAKYTQSLSAEPNTHTHTHSRDGGVTLHMKTGLKRRSDADARQKAIVIF